MKKFIDKILSLSPYVVLLVLIGVLLDFVHRQDLNFDQINKLIGTIIWPTVVFFAFLFFRRVITYLFFSMEEFGFFGTRGELKDVREVINERVEQKFVEDKAKEEQDKKLSIMQEQLRVAAQSQADTKTEVEENFKLAKSIFEDYKKLLTDHEKVTKELDEFKLEKAERASRMEAIRQRIRYRNLVRSSDPSPEEIDAAGEAHIQQKLDEERGK